MATLVLFILALICGINGHSEHLPSLLALNQRTREAGVKRSADWPVGAESKYMTNIKAITNSGTNAEAYWSFDGKNFSFQAIRQPLSDTHNCDVIYRMGADGSGITQVSPGVGRTTCSYFYPDGEHILYSQTTRQPECPPTPDMEMGYAWPVYKDMDIFVRNIRTGQIKHLPMNGEGYDAESTLSPDGKHVIFTSARDGDLELYTMDLEGKNLRRLTYTPGYDGGAYFSFDNKKFVWRANRPKGEALTEYFRLLEFGIVIPTDVQIMVQDVDLNTPPIQLTNNDATNFAPFFLPDGSGVIFASNLHDPKAFDIQLFIVDMQGNIEQVTTEGHFNTFPMFSPDGKKIAWCSDRGTTKMGDINVIVADWIGPGTFKQH